MRIKEFHFRWSDAWHQIDDGYDTILEASNIGKVTLQCLVNLEVQQIDLTGRENEFIDFLEACNIKAWNGKCYRNYDCFDGTIWTLDVAYDDVSIRAKGMNGYPTEFADFIKILCEQWGLGQSKINRGMAAWINQEVKETVIEEMTDFEKSMPAYL